ncbi:hypothetical protein FHV99_004633 [Ochrobactrum sp. P20RRXII]|nr:DUF4262 domain-containing protein [Ochrobactrum sp. P20RRXII]NIH77381.1 hypothetical protein [Ochrobactrum sp. P20RRXII]
MRSVIEQNIKTAGQHIIGVFDPEQKRDSFAYTVGNAPQGFPELLLIGSFPPNVMMMMLNAVGTHMRNAESPLEEGMLDIDWTFPFKIRKTGERAKADFTVQAGQYLGREDYEVLQVMICDKHGKYPGDAGVAEGFDVEQP